MPGRMRASAGPLDPLAVLALLFLLLWYGLQHVGPRSEGPSEDPLVSINRRADELEQNAASLYLEASQSLLESLKDLPKYDPEFPSACLEVAPGQPLAAELAAWVRRQEGWFEEVRQASQMPNCQFRVQRDTGPGLLDTPYLSNAKDLARFAALRAQLAIERQDLDVCADSTLVGDRIARHILQHPAGSPQYLTGLAAHNLSNQYILRPLEWDTVSGRARRDYIRRIIPVLQASENPARAILAERDWTCWMVKELLGQKTVDLFGHRVPVSRFLPLDRVYGEIDQYTQPVAALARAPVEELQNPENPHRRRLDAVLERLKPGWGVALSLPTYLANVCRPAHARTLELYRRTIASQRGMRTVLELHLYADKHGVVPANLEELGGDHIIDPYTAQPFIYRRTQDGFTLYSAGIDGDDDGGAHHPRFGERYDEPDDGDYVFWPLPER
jgi:hypothetical protein